MSVFIINDLDRFLEINIEETRTYFSSENKDTVVFHNLVFDTSKNIEHLCSFIMASISRVIFLNCIVSYPNYSNMPNGISILRAKTIILHGCIFNNISLSIGEYGNTSKVSIRDTSIHCNIILAVSGEVSVENSKINNISYHSFHENSLSLINNKIRSLSIKDNDSIGINEFVTIRDTKISKGIRFDLYKTSIEGVQGKNSIFVQSLESGSEVSMRHPEFSDFNMSGFNLGNVLFEGSIYFFNCDLHNMDINNGCLSDLDYVIINESCKNVDTVKVPEGYGIRNVQEHDHSFYCIERILGKG